MAVLSDTQIKERALNGMITPFVDKLITQDKNVKVLSYGLSSYGYDIR
ncbi:MAG TPA: dCTP deaminase, partial [Alteromonas australica]|nr:dCTP deaminase [Alteromonas australica]